MTDRKKALLAMAFATLFWGINFPVAKIATNELDPFFIGAVRILFASIVFWFLLPPERRSELARADRLKGLLPLSLSGILINQLCFITGIHRTTPGHAAVLMAMIPIFVGILALFFLKEKLPWAGWLGIFLGFAGAVGVIYSSAPDVREVTLLGDILVLCATLFFSFYTVWGRGQVKKHGALFVTAGAYIGAAPVALFLLAFGLSRQDWSQVTWKGLSALAYMLIFTTVLCFLAYFWALGRMKAAQVAIFADCQPVLGASISIWLGMDLFGPLFAGSALVALSGVAVVQMFARK